MGIYILLLCSYTHATLLRNENHLNEKNFNYANRSIKDAAPNDTSVGDGNKVVLIQASFPPSS